MGFDSQFLSAMKVAMERVHRNRYIWPVTAIPQWIDLIWD
jgi:hypothetical protein